MSIEAGLQRYETVNNLIKVELSKRNKVTVKDVNGQRYIGCALDSGKTIEIHGTPGNDLACYLNGGKIVVYGSGQDAVGNTMNGGEIIIHGTAETRSAMVCGTAVSMFGIMLPAAAESISRNLKR